jgi:hypothetical protein
MFSQKLWKWKLPFIRFSDHFNRLGFTFCSTNTASFAELIIDLHASILLNYRSFRAVFDANATLDTLIQEDNGLFRPPAPRFF